MLADLTVVDKAGSDVVDALPPLFTTGSSASVRMAVAALPLLAMLPACKEAARYLSHGRGLTKTEISADAYLAKDDPHV